MNDVLEKLIKRHDVFVQKSALQLESNEYSSEFGGSVCLKYRNDKISLMITKSRDGLCYFVGPSVLENRNWYSVDIVWNFLQGNAEYKKMKQSDQFSFIQDSYIELTKVFDENERELRLKKLHQLELSRSRKLFGRR